MDIKDYKIGVYVRVAHKDDEAIKRQEEMVLAYCRYRCFPEVVKIYSDNGKPGTTENRPAYKRLLKDVRDGKINVIIASNFSRLTRQPVLFYHKMIDYITKKGLLLLCIDTESSDQKKSYSKVMLDVAILKEMFGGVE